MKNTIISIIIILLVFQLNAQEQTTVHDVSTYYFIRHAEKTSDDINPELSQEGLQRAQKWAEIFKNITFDAIYSTDYIRTKNTAAPTAKSQGLEVNLYDPKNLDYKDFLKETRRKTILVVGHSNTIPDFVNKLIGKEKYELIDHENYGNLYIVDITKNTITDKLLIIE